MNATRFRIVDAGRGPHVEGQRIAVSDIFYYLHRCYDFDFIHEAMPSLTREQFQAVVEYSNLHWQELVEDEWRLDPLPEGGMEAPHASGGVSTDADENLTIQERVLRLKKEMKATLANISAAHYAE